MAAAGWIEVPQAQARAHRLYGIGGWLSLFAILLALETGLATLLMISAIRNQGMPLRTFLVDGDDWALFPKLAMGVLIITTLIILAVLLRRAPTFRPWAMSALLARGPLFVAAYWFTLHGQDGGIRLVPLLALWLAECVIWTTYLQRSARVRVTYENRVRGRSDDAVPGSPGLRYVGDGINTPLRPTREPTLGTAATASPWPPAAAPSTGPLTAAAPSAASPVTAPPVTASPVTAPPVTAPRVTVTLAAIDLPSPVPGKRETAVPPRDPATAPALTADAAIARPADAPAPELESTKPLAVAPREVPVPSFLASEANRRFDAGQRFPSVFGGGAPNDSGAEDPTFPPIPSGLPDDVWAAALDEFDGPTRQRGLWARLFAQFAGDEKRAQAAYLAIRAKTLGERRP